ncbi:MAG: histone deacetylase [Acidobacteriia bacterium]|nr:histone deacetylase [Terriglobia bacterium]
MAVYRILSGSPGQPQGYGGGVVRRETRQTPEWSRGRGTISLVTRRLFYCDHYAIPLPPGHKFPAEKYALLRALLTADGCYDLQPAPLADPSAIELAHDAGYVRQFLNGTLDTRTMRRIGFPWSKELVRRTLASVGGTLAAAAEALATGFGGNLAGGMHHAFHAEGSGFCVFNDLAIAILALRRDGDIRRAAVIDLDVHQGDGTASIFEDDPAVLTVSIHGENNFPSRKQRSGIDIGLPDGTGDEQYLTRLREVLPAIADFRPDILFYQSGVDTLAGDRLGRLQLTHEGLMERDHAVFEFTKALEIRVVVTLGGGYADPIARTAEAHANTYRVAALVFTQPETPGGRAASLKC